MRVLMLTWYCDGDDVSESGVAHRWVSEIAKDHDVSLLAVSHPDRLGCVREQFPHIDVTEWSDIRLPSSMERFQAIVKPGYAPYYFKARRFLKRLLARESFDIIHHLAPFSWRYPSPAVGLGVPVIRGPVAGGVQTPSALASTERDSNRGFMRLRDADTMRLKFDPSLRNTYQRADHVMLAAPYLRDILGGALTADTSVEVEHGLPEVAQNTPTRGPDVGEPIRLIFVGRIIRTKGVRDAIRALQHLPNAELTVVGDGDDYANCIRESDELGLTERVHFTGWLDREQVKAAYGQSHILLFPSFREPTGGVVLEAMENGLPCIVCNHGGPATMIDDDCGIRVDPAPEKEFAYALAEAVQHYSSHPERIETASKAALKRARDAFSWTAKRQRITSVYKRVASAKNKKSVTGSS